MADYFRPKRGKKSTAIQQRLVLKKGEMFVECPDSGMGTGLGRIKIGDGRSTYENLPYFVDSTTLPSEHVSVDITGTAFTHTDLEGVVREIDTALKDLKDYVNEIISERLDGKKFKIMTIAEYEALPEEQKTSDTIFMCMKDPEEETPGE